MTTLGELPTDHLAIVVFGPGYGESIALHAPDGRWLVVDSLREPRSERNPPLELLIDCEARPDLLILTHPHEDHAAGFADLIERQDTAGGRIGAVPVSTGHAGDPLRHPDAGAALRRSRARLALSAIQARWDAAPNARWLLGAGEHAMLGEARIDVLTPRTALLGRADVDPNRLSAAVLLEWSEVRVLLGADVPSAEWQRVDAAAQLGRHALFKVAHHGSARAQHRRLSQPADLARTWILSPWSRAGRHLPRLGDGEDLDRLLEQVDRAELTSPPVALREAPPTTTDRAELASLADRATFGGDDLLLEYDDDPRSPDEAWVAAILSASGELVELRRGTAAVTVRR